MCRYIYEWSTTTEMWCNGGTWCDVTMMSVGRLGCESWVQEVHICMHTVYNTYMYSHGYIMYSHGYIMYSHGYTMYSQGVLGRVQA